MPALVCFRFLYCAAKAGGVKTAGLTQPYQTLSLTLNRSPRSNLIISPAAEVLMDLMDLPSGEPPYRLRMRAGGAG